MHQSKLLRVPKDEKRERFERSNFDLFHVSCVLNAGTKNESAITKSYAHRDVLVVFSTKIKALRVFSLLVLSLHLGGIATFSHLL